jgi:hypothetical protein
MTTLTDEERLMDLTDRTHKLEVLDGLDKLKAKQERERRVAMKQHIKEEHHTIRVTREENAFRFAEPINNLAAWYRFVGAAECEELYPALKWSTMIRDGVLRRVGDGFLVQMDVAEAKGYEIVEVD